MEFEAIPRTFAVTTVFVPKDGKVIVHAWGPFASRKLANAAKGRMKRRHESREREGDSVPGYISYHVGEMGDPDHGGITITDSASGQPKTVQRCPECESGGVQCYLVKGHTASHWIPMNRYSNVPKETHPEAYYMGDRA